MESGDLKIQISKKVLTFFYMKLGTYLYLYIFYLFRSLFCGLKAYFSYFGAPTYDSRVIKPAVDTH